MTTSAMLTGCGTGGTPWGATPRSIEIPIPDLSRVPQVLEGASGSTAGAQRVAERVRAALAAEPRLAGTRIAVDGFEGGLVVLSGAVTSAAERNIALATARQVAGVGQVVDRLSLP